MGNDNILIRVGADITQFSRSMQQAQNQLSEFNNANKATFDSFKKVGAAVTGAGLAIAGGLALSVKEAASFQSAFAGVKKTVDASESEFAALEKGIRDMAKVLPASANEIAGVAEAAGQLGIKKENILAFARTMIDLGESTNLTADQAATAFARFANITQMPQTEFDKLGSVVVALGNSMATTEAEIVEMGMRLAAQGKQVGMTESQIMALAGTMSSLGIEAEAGGSAMTTVLKKIQSAVMTGGKFLDHFAEAAGSNSKDFAAAWNDDPIVALDMFTKGLSESSAAGGNLAETLAFLGIKGIREQDVLLRMAGASDLLTEAVGTSSKAWDENSALTNEAAQRYETFESKLAMFKNVIKDVGITIGNVLLPFVTTLVDKLSSFVGAFSELNPKLIEGGVAFAAVAAAVALVVGPFLMLVGFLPSILGGFVALKTVFLAITGPIGLTVMAIVAIGAGLVLAYNKVEWFRDGVDKAFQAIKGVVSTLITATVDVAKKLLNDLKAYWATNSEGILQNAKTTFETIKTTLSNIVKDVVSFVKEQLDKFKAFWDENGTAIKLLVKLAFDGILNHIKMVMGIIQGVFQAIWPIIAGVTKVAWNTIKLTIGNAIDLILGIIQTVLKLIQGDWKGAWETIKGTSEKIVNNIVKIFKEVDLAQVGKDIIKGLIKGISSMASAVGDTVKSVANNIKNTFTKLFDIHSPSRVMAGYGDNIGQGLTIGIKSSGIKAVDAVVKIAKDIVSPMKDLGATPIGLDDPKSKASAEKSYEMFMYFKGSGVVSI